MYLPAIHLRADDTILFRKDGRKRQGVVTGVTPVDDRHRAIVLASGDTWTVTNYTLVAVLAR